MGEPSQPPPLSPSRVPPEETFDFDRDANHDVEFDQRVEHDDDTGA